MARHIPQDIAGIPFDAIIIGAGINGVGIARDASMRGLRVLLLDKGDISAGTTAWSTRLIHGGLRYLEHGEPRLVRESLSERETLLRIAPHLVRPLPLLVPIYEGARRGPYTIRAGMIAYDLLSFDKSLPRYRMLSRAETLQRAPGIEGRGLRGAVIFYDAQVEYAERLAVENGLSAREHGATVVTYARVESVQIEGGAVGGVEFSDRLGGGTYVARAPLVVNAAGPWVDEVLNGSIPSGRKFIGGTKGSHLVVNTFPGAPELALYAEARVDGRPFFIIPWDGKILIGTTDTRYDGDLDCVTTNEAEIAYLLDEANRVMPQAQLTRDRVHYTYSGVRPLPFVGAGAEAGITRRHFVHTDTHGVRGLISIVGGKLTTYRNLSEEAVDSLFKNLGRTSPPCQTAQATLPGAATNDFQAFVVAFRKECALPVKTIERLLKVYGVRAAEVARLAVEDAGLRREMSVETGSIGAEVLFSFQSELAETLADCLLRRTMIGLNSALGLDAVEAAALIARDYLGWDAARAASEVVAYGKYVARFRPAANGQE